jgi:hypothetical protein
MTGGTRMRAKLCAINEQDDYNDFKDTCKLTFEEMTVDDPTE